MPGASYQLLYYTDDGQLLDVFPIGQTADINCVYTQNTAGSLTVTLPARGLFWGDFAVDRILVLERNYGAGYYPEGDQAWFLRDWTFAQSGGVETVTLNAVSGNDLLDGRIVAYAAGSAQATKTAKADDMMKAVVRENLGSSATDTARQLAGLSVAADLGLGPTIIKSFARKNVLRLLEDICDQAAAEAGVTLFYDVIMTTPGSFEFKTWVNRRGIDRSSTSGQPLVLTPSDVSVSELHGAERNYIYCGGGGLEEERIIKTATRDEWVQESRWNRREKWVDARNAATNETYIQAQANAAMWYGRPRLRLEGILNGQEGLTYGLDYRFGDVIGCQYRGVTFDCHISTVSIRYINGEETLQIRVRSEK